MRSIRMTMLQSQDGNPLSLETIEARIPSIHTRTAYDGAGLTDKFVPVATIDVLRALLAEGFAPFAAGQTWTREPGRAPFARHILRMRSISDAHAVRRQVGDEFPEVVILNANDGTTSYRMSAGLMRLACLNGLVVASASVTEVKVRHTGGIVDRVIDGVYKVVKDFPVLGAAVAKWKGIQLDRADREDFAISALAIKYGTDRDFPVEVDEVLGLRRPEDNGSDLWRVFNVVQENLVRGGLFGRSASGRRLTTRPVTGISANVDLNRQLWELAERFAKGRE